MKVEVSFPKKFSKKPLDGRMLLMISDDGSDEPRFQITSDLNTQLIFGVDVDGLKPNEAVLIDGNILGYPLKSINEIPAGDYWAQALLHKYENFYRADGHIVKLPMDRGEGQKWWIAPGNLYSAPKSVRIDPNKKSTIKIRLDRNIPPFTDRKDTKYIKYIRMQSNLLSEFWGRPWYLEAIILLPEGFTENPDRKYPLVLCHDHHHRIFTTPVQFREIPPDPDLPPEPIRGSYYPEYNKTEQEYAYKFYKDWTSADYPRYILATVQHPTPYFDDSYAVNSQITGPFGDAINFELIPYIEKKYRGIGEGWARVVHGGSTGGWEALATQIFYPDMYNGCWAWCPDPVDFRALGTTNIYEDENAFYYNSKWKKRTPKPQQRTTNGQIKYTLQEISQMEHVIGTKGRSNGEPNCWLTVFGPVGEDGYPKLLWDKLTGKIDHSVAEYMRENYDLRYILERDWKKIGSKLRGKIHIYVGDMDNLYYTNAVYLMHEFLEYTKDPYYEGEVLYGDRFGHCWSGDHVEQYAVSRLTVNQRLIPEMIERMIKTAPPGVDLSWRGNWKAQSPVDISKWRSRAIAGWHADKDKKM